MLFVYGLLVGAAAAGAFWYFDHAEITKLYAEARAEVAKLEAALKAKL